MGPQPLVCVSECVASVVMGIDPFHPDEADTLAVCPLDLGDLGDGVQPVILDICTFPSAHPNSDPSDCILSATTPTALTVGHIFIGPSGEASPLIIIAFTLLLFITIVTAGRLAKMRKIT